jgi:hypothetical protein
MEMSKVCTHDQHPFCSFTITLFCIIGQSDGDPSSNASPRNESPSEVDGRTALSDVESTQIDDSEFTLPPASKKRKRSAKKDETHAEKIKFVRKKANVKAKLPAHMNYTVEGIKSTWNAETDYGASFREMDEIEQLSEVKRLNKGAEKGLKGVIKTKLIDSNYKVIVSESMRVHLKESGLPTASMFHAPFDSNKGVIANPNFISVGEWVEVDADRTPGYNSEGCIAVIVGVHDDPKDDTTFDPRRSDHKTGKDGKFVCVKRGTVKPKNALTVTYLCFAFDVPYTTFKRWKNDAFISKKIVPDNKGKHVLTHKPWAAQVFNARRMFVSHSMEIWLQKHPAKKHDTLAKQVNETVLPVIT